MKYIQPEAYLHSFTCPHCGTIAQQQWWGRDMHNNVYKDEKFNTIRVSECIHCKEHTLWIEDKMLYPDTGLAPVPNPQMPESVQKLYYEAASIHIKSPRGAAALLRLGIQILCKELGEKGKNINNDIGNLVEKGLPEIVQQSLDIVRVTGNNAVHPGQIDTDSPETVGNLFELINIIVEYMIALPNKVSGIYNSLPGRLRDSIKERDDK